MGGRATTRTCLTLMWIGSVWTWGRRGWGEVGGDELSQTQTQRSGSKKTDYDANPRLLHSSAAL